MWPPAAVGGRRLVCHPAQGDAWITYRILWAGLVLVNDLGTQAYEYYCGVGGMVSGIS